MYKCFNCGKYEHEHFKVFEDSPYSWCSKELYLKWAVPKKVENEDGSYTMIPTENFSEEFIDANTFISYR